MGNPSLIRFAGLRIVQNPYLPLRKIPGPMAVHRSKGHPLVYWLSRQLARIGIALEPDMLTPYQTWIDDPVFYQHTDMVFVHPQHYPALMELLRKADQNAPRT